MDSNVVLHKISPFLSVSSCIILSIIYVASLYVWSTEHNRYGKNNFPIRKFACYEEIVESTRRVFYCFNRRPVCIRLQNSTPFNMFILHERTGCFVYSNDVTLSKFTSLDLEIIRQQSKSASSAFSLLC